MFDPSDEGRGEPLAVLTHLYWSRRFAADPAVVGQSLTLDGRSYTVAGVLQEDVGPLESSVAMFTVGDWPTPKRKGPFFMMAVARLRPGVSPETATSALRATNARLFPIWRFSYQDEKATWGMQDLKSRVVGDIGSMLFLVLAAVGCVLLIACANAVNLLVARALARNRELAIRGALGASRGRLALHLLAETTVLTLGSAVVGFGVAFGAIQLVAAYGTSYIPRTSEIQLSGFSLMWLAGLSVVSGLLIGIIPAFQNLRLRMGQALRSSSRGATDGPATRRLRRTLVAGEFAIATPLIVAAVLLLASLDQLSRVPVGVEIERTLTASLILSGPRYGEDPGRREFWKRALDRVAALPGVQSVALADSRPPVESGNRNNFDLEDKPTPPGQNQPICTWVAVSPGFFKAVGVRLERGRLFDEQIVEPNALVVDRAWANRFFPGEDVVGRRLVSGGCTTCPPSEVIGVVSDVKWTGLEATPDGTVYTRFVQPQTGFVILRTAADPSSLSRALEGALKEIDPALPLMNVATGEELVANALVTPRYLTPASRHVRADRARAVRCRHLWRDGAFRRAAHTRHRHPARARRRPIGDASLCRHAGFASRCRGRGRRSPHGIPDDAADVVGTVWRQPDRSADDGRGSRRPRGGRPHRVPHPGPPRRAAEPRGDAAGGVNHLGFRFTFLVKRNPRVVQPSPVSQPNRSAAYDFGVQRQPAAESADDVAEDLRIDRQRVRINRGHVTPPAQRIEPHDDLADVQLGARPVAFGETLDAADENVRPEPTDVPAEGRDTAVGRDEQRKNVEAVEILRRLEPRVVARCALHERECRRAVPSMTVDERHAVFTKDAAETQEPVVFP